MNQVNIEWSLSEYWVIIEWVFNATMNIWQFRIIQKFHKYVSSKKVQKKHTFFSIIFFYFFDILQIYTFSDLCIFHEFVK